MRGRVAERSDDGNDTAAGDERTTAWSARGIVFATVMPLVASSIGLLLYNLVRFDDLFDFGYLTQNVAERLASDLQQHGQFNLRYLPKNLWYMVAAPPTTESSYAIGVAPNPEGMSVLLTTPAIVWFAVEWWRRRAARDSADPDPALTHIRRAGWTSVLLTLVPILTYYNTGWFQFGYRFLLDLMPVVVLLLAMAMSAARLRAAFDALVVVSIAVNVYGLAWFHWATG